MRKDVLDFPAFDSNVDLPNARLELIDSIGRSVWNKEVDVETGRYLFSDFNQSNLNAGIYFLVLSWEGHRIAEKIITQ